MCQKSVVLKKKVEHENNTRGGGDSCIKFYRVLKMPAKNGGQSDVTYKKWGQSYTLYTVYFVYGMKCTFTIRVDTIHVQ